MAGRGPQTFKKRQKEQQRKEKQQEKLAKRLARKRQNRSPNTSEAEELSTSLEMNVRYPVAFEKLDHSQ